MPIYEYACKACTHTFDALQKMAEPALVECPECGEASLRKLLSAPRFRLKGKGWYETDFKTGDQRNIAGEADAKAKSDDGAAADGKSKETKAGDADKTKKKDTKKDTVKSTKAADSKAASS